MSKVLKHFAIGVGVLIGLVFLIPVLIFMFYIIVLPMIVGVKYKIFPTKTIDTQLNVFSPLEVKLPGENWVPQRIEPGEFDNEFVVYAYFMGEEESWNYYRKALFLVDESGNVIDDMEINLSCQAPYSISDVGMVMTYCQPQTSNVYRVVDGKIIHIETVSAFKYNSKNSVAYNSLRFEKDGSDNYLNDNYSYRYQCTKACWPDGGCCGLKTALVAGDKKVSIDSYSLRDFITLSNGKIAIIFGKGDPSRSNNSNKLLILK